VEGKARRSASSRERQQPWGFGGWGLGVGVWILGFGFWVLGFGV